MGYVIRAGRRRVTLAGLIVFLALARFLASSPVRASSPTLTVGSATVAVGQTASIPFVLGEAPSGMAVYDVVVTLGSSAVAHLVGAEFPEFGLTSQKLVSSAEIHLKVADLMQLAEAGAANVTLATITVEGVKKGNTDIQIVVNRLDDNGGSPVGAHVASGSVSVQKAGGSRGNKRNADNSGSGGKGRGKGGKK